MTTYGDVLQSGSTAITSGLSSISPVTYCRTFRFSGGSGTQNFVFPAGVQNVDAKLYIETNGSGATTDKITVSAGGTDMITITSFGSTSGVLRNTTVGLGTLSTIASACANLSTTAEVSAAATLLSVDAAAVYQLQINYSLLRKTDT